jgi:hypothetical protein
MQMPRRSSSAPAQRTRSTDSTSPTIARPALADFDRDGDLDLVCGTEGGRFRYFQNAGTATAPSFARGFAAANPLDGEDLGDRSAPAAADLNGDGRPDLVTGSLAGTFAVHYFPEPARALLFACGQRAARRVARPEALVVRRGDLAEACERALARSLAGRGATPAAARGSARVRVAGTGATCATWRGSIRSMARRSPYASPAIGDFDRDGSTPICIVGAAGGRFTYLRNQGSVFRSDPAAAVCAAQPAREHRSRLRLRARARPTSTGTAISIW